MNVILLHNNHKHVSSITAAILRVERTRIKLQLERIGMNSQLKLWIVGDVSGYSVIILPSYTRVTLLVLFKNIEHLINALSMEHKKHIQGCFVHQNFATRFQTMRLFPMRIFPGNRLFDTCSRINDDLKRGNTSRDVLNIYRNLASCNQNFKI